MGEKHPQSPIGKESLLAQVLEKKNLIRALKQVKRNKGMMWRNGFDGSYGVICGNNGKDRATKKLRRLGVKR